MVNEVRDLRTKTENIRHKSDGKGWKPKNKTHETKDRKLMTES